MIDEGLTTDDTTLTEERDPRSSWKGRGVEALVAAHCLLACGGRLNVSTPLVDDSGTDLIFHLRGQPATLAVQVKTRFTSALQVANRRSFRTHVRRATFRPRGDLALLFVLYDDTKHLLSDAWLVPALDFDRLTRGQTESRKFLVFAASLGGTENVWYKFRYDRLGFPERLITLLQGLNAPPGTNLL